MDNAQPASDPIRAPAASAAASGALAQWWLTVEREPHAHDLFHALRWIDALAGGRKPLGRDTVARYEPVRLRQEPSLAFAPSTVARARPAEGGRPAELSIYSFGLFGPNGPLPLHLTEHAHERVAHHGDRTLSAFADVFHHRLILLFYRAWADAQSTVSLDRKDERFTRYVASLLHIGEPSMRRRDAVLDHAKYYMAGHLTRQTRNPEGLKHILQSFFRMPVHIREFVPQWIRLEPEQRLGLGGFAGLGRDTVLGVAVRDAQHKFRIEIGPLALEDYLSFLPGGTRARQLTHWVRHYIGMELAWDLRPVLRAEDARGLTLGAQRPLGLSSWLGKRRPEQGEACDLVLDYESRGRVPQRGRPPAPTSTPTRA